MSITNSQSLHKLISIELVMRSNHLILCHPFPSSIFPSIRVFSNESALHIRWPKYWSFSFSISPSSEYSGLIAFRMDWFDLQGTLESSPAPQFESVNSLVLSLLQRRQWQPTPVLLPGKFHGQRSLVGCSPWGREDSDTTERLHFHFSLSCMGEGNGNPLQCSCLENPKDGGALVGCHLWGRTELDTTEAA